MRENSFKMYQNSWKMHQNTFNMYLKASKKFQNTFQVHVKKQKYAENEEKRNFTLVDEDEDTLLEAVPELFVPDRDWGNPRIPFIFA